MFLIEWEVFGRPRYIVDKWKGPYRTICYLTVMATLLKTGVGVDKNFYLAGKAAFERVLKMIYRFMSLGKFPIIG